MGGTRHLVCGELTTGFIVSLSFSLFLASTCFLSSFIPLWLPPCLWRFAIKTAVTQSKTVKPELRPHSPACLLCPVFFFFFSLFLEFFLENKREKWIHGKAWNVRSCSMHSSSVWHFAGQKSKTRIHVSPEQYTLFFLSAVSFILFLSTATKCPAAPAEQLSNPQNRSLSCKRQL